MVWQINQSDVKIAIKTSLLLKVNRLSTKKKDSKTNHKGVRLVEPQKNSKGAAADTAVAEIEAITGGIPAVVEIDGKIKGE